MNRNKMRRYPPIAVTLVVMAALALGAVTAIAREAAATPCRLLRLRRGRVRMEGRVCGDLRGRGLWLLRRHREYESGGKDGWHSQNLEFLFECGGHKFYR